MLVADYSSNHPFHGSSQIGIGYARNENDVRALTLDMLSRELNTGRVVAFVGSGVSIAYGHLTWQGFARSIVSQALDMFSADEEILPAASRILLRSFNESQRASATPHAGHRFEITPGDHTLIVLEECRSCFERAQKLDVLYDLIRNPFHPTVGEPGSLDPLEKIIRQLGIRRFVTTNYDFEIEKAFVRVLGSPSRDLNLPTASGSPTEDPLSPESIGPLAQGLSVNPAETEALVQFAIGSPGFERGVFHCHGRSTEPEDTIITERDYQRIYLHPDPRHIAYREAFELVFSANPVLFLGLGMQESDILRPLRQFVSERRSTPNERPLFALMERPFDQVEEVKVRKYLYTRYGVKVIFYNIPESPDPKARTQAFCKAIHLLADTQQRWWRNWQRIPPLRTPTFQTHGSVRTHHREKSTSQVFESTGNDQVLNTTLKTVRKDGGLVIVLGCAGAGKGNLGLRVAEGELKISKRGFKKRFFATTRFTNEFLSVIESAADFFLGNSARATMGKNSLPPLQRLEKALSQRRNLLVLGGIERLLVERTVSLPHEGASTHDALDPRAQPAETWTLPLGDPITPEIQHFLSILPKASATVVLTTSLLPSNLSPTEYQLARIPGVEQEDVVKKFTEALDDQCPPLVEEFFQCLRGHAYALAVILEQVRAINSPRDALSWLARLHTRLTSMEHSQRSEFVIHAAIDRLASSSTTEERRILLSILHRVALFTTPVTRSAVLLSMPRQVEEFGSDRLERKLEDLKDLRLLCEISRSEGKDGEPRYTAHTLVRAHVLQLIGAGPRVGEPQRFVLPGFTHEAEEPQPVSEDAHRLTVSSVDALLMHLEDAVAGNTKSPLERSEVEEIRSRARAVFGMIRSRWNALTLCELSTISREPHSGRNHYDAYQLRLLRLYNALLLTACRTGVAWSGFEAKGSDQVERDHEGILYADELSWLSNETGLVAYCKGQLHDAFALWSLGFDINRRIERGARGSRWLQSSLNQCAVQIERGNLQRARAQLEQVLMTAEHVGDQNRLGRAWGYLGWVHHLGADFGRAESSYSHALEILVREGVNRGSSFFYRLRADLRRWVGDAKKAKDDLRKSLAAAELGRHFDLAHFTRVSQAFLDLANDHPTADHTTAAGLDRILAFSRRMGIPKLEADVCKVLGELSLRSGDMHRAGRFARRSLALACRNGMNLRVTSILGLLGHIQKGSGNSRGAYALFIAAVRLGRAQGYRLQVEGIERQLRELEGRFTAE